MERNAKANVKIDCAPSTSISGLSETVQNDPVTDILSVTESNAAGVSSIPSDGSSIVLESVVYHQEIVVPLSEGVV